MLLRVALLTGGQRGEFVGAIVLGVRRVAFGPAPACGVARGLVIEQFPEIAIDDGLLLRRDPAAFFPVGDPECDAVFHVLGIGDDLNVATFTQRGEAFNSACELHAVVCGVRFATEKFLAMFTVKKYGGPTAGAWISEACAVGDELNFFHSNTLVPLRDGGRGNFLKHFCIFLFYFSSTCYIIEDGRITQHGNKESRKEGSPQEGCRKEKGRKEKVA